MKRLCKLHFRLAVFRASRSDSPVAGCSVDHSGVENWWVLRTYMREAGGPVRRGGTSRLINTDYTSAMHSIVASLISGHLTDDTAAPHVSAEMLFESHGAVTADSAELCFRIGWRIEQGAVIRQ
jgi:hypothetical protein